MTKYILGKIYGTLPQELIYAQGFEDSNGILMIFPSVYKKSTYKLRSTNRKRGA